METLGVWLRQTREAGGGTLKDAEAATHIRVRFLEMLEAGEFAALPGGEIQARGFLRIYARYLELSPDKVLARYDAETRSTKAVPPGAPADAQLASPVAPQPQSIPASTSLPRRMRRETLLIVGGALIVLVVIVAGAWYLRNRSADEEAVATSTTTAPSAAVPSPPETPAAPAVTPTFAASPQGDVTLALEATEHVWACVTTDGTTVFEGLLAPGQVETWSGEEAVTVDTGNGAGLLVTVNGQQQGAMCGRGEVCIRAWGPSGEILAP
jgi:cytoskeletal protein RodZ